MDFRKFAQDVFSDQFGKAVPETHELVRFSDIQVGDCFIDDSIVFEKLSDADPDDPLDRGLARGPRCHPLGSGVYEFRDDDDVEAV